LCKSESKSSLYQETLSSYVNCSRTLSTVHYFHTEE
jgi:hypothetical protein